MSRKVFDWGGRFGIIAVVALLGGAVAAQESPAKKKARDSKVVSEEEAGEGEEDVIEITVKVPKPEVFLFGQAQDVDYQELDVGGSFMDEVMDAAKRSPF